MKKNEKMAGAKPGRTMPRMLEMRALELARLTPHPDAEAFGAEAEDRAALGSSVAECGLLDPVSVIVAIDTEERYLVIDGCGRLSALRAAGAERAPCMVFDLGDFSVREFALHRNTMQRKVTTGQRVLCALATMGADGTAPGNTPGVSRETRKDMAAKLGCSQADIAAARELMEETEKEGAEAAREVYEDVLAGRTPIRRWKAALAGREATKDKPKKPIDYAALASRVCASLDTLFKAWPSLKGAVKGEIEDALCEALSRAPFALPEAAKDGEGQPSPSPSERR